MSERTQFLSEIPGFASIPRPELRELSAYMAPEALRGEAVDGRADIYALGTMAFELATMQRPFQAKEARDMARLQLRQPPQDIRRLRPDLPEGIARFIDEALIKDPARRIRDWSRIKELLAPPTIQGVTEGQRTLERTLRIRYTAHATARVEQRLAQAVDELSAIPGANAELEPTPDASAIGLPIHRPCDDPTVDDAPGAASLPTAKLPGDWDTE